MKSIILTLAISLLLGGFLFAQEWGQEHRDTFGKNVIVDSLFAVDRLTGSIYYQHNYYTVDANWQEGETYIGDFYNMGWMFWFASIGYLTFELPTIPEGYNLSSASLKIYFYSYIGNSNSCYPIFDYGSSQSYPAGILEHVDYGSGFNADDIEPDSIYAAYQLFDHESFVPHTFINYDVTDCIVRDITNERGLSQFRVLLSGYSDWDNWEDCIVYSSHSYSFTPEAPRIIYTLSDGSSVQESVLPIQNLSVSCYPNPFTEQSTITVKTPVPGKPELCVYNLKGQRVRDLECSSEEGKEYGYRWDGRDNAGKAVSNGIYLLKFSLDGREAGVKRLVLAR